MRLSDTSVRKAKAAAKPYKISDEAGLYVLVNPNGSKLWRMDYQFQKKRKTLAIGAYPAFSVADARKQRDAAREALQRGDDPSTLKKLDKLRRSEDAANTFEVIADEYVAKRTKEGVAQATLDKLNWILEQHAKPLRPRPIAAISAVEILTILQALEKSNHRETAKRVRSTLGRVFRYAAATGRATQDPTALLKDAVSAPTVKSHAAITDEKQFGALMACIDEYDGAVPVRYALEFIALVACRPGELRKAEWFEFDMAKRTWTIPAERMKMRVEHVIPLSDQALTVLNKARGVTRGMRYVFSGIRGKERPLSENTMNAALKRMGYKTEEHVSHGFRSSFSTIMNERGYDPEIIEHALAHKDNSVRGIYNRSKYWDDRVALMQAWADLVDELKGLPPKRDTEFEDLGI